MLPIKSDRVIRRLQAISFNPRQLSARVRFAYVSFLEFGNGRSRFVDQVNGRCFDNRRDGRLRLRFFPRKLSRLGALGLVTFLWLQGSRGSLSCFTSYGHGGLPRPTAHCRLSFTYGNSLFALSHYRLHCRVLGPTSPKVDQIRGWPRVYRAGCWPSLASDRGVLSRHARAENCGVSNRTRLLACHAV